MDIIIDGKYYNKQEKIKVYNPYNLEIIDTVPNCDVSDVENVIDAAFNAKSKLIEMSSFKLSNILNDIVNDLINEKELFSNTLTKETGKPISDSIFEIERSIETLKLSAEEAKRIYGESIPLDAGLGGKGFFSFTQKIPLGVVLAITPFNYPVNLAIHKIAPAIASKNTVILKPSSEAPLSALKLVELFNRHLPDGVINSITGNGSTIGNALIESKKINKISFTGSVEVGSSISKKSEMKRLNLELGGNDPLIILNDADIDKAVLATVNGSYLFSGQVCMGVKRIIIEEKIADEFISKLKIETEKLKVGDPMDSKTKIGPLINEEAAILVENRVKNTIKQGAQLVLGGNRDGNFFTPTILDHVKNDMDIVKNETFGPVSPIIRVNNVNEAIKIANDSIYGLQAGVYTENIHDALKCAHEIDCGSVMINKQPTFRTDNMPFGGFKSSGMGKEGVKYAIESMMKTKLIALNRR